MGRCEANQELMIGAAAPLINQKSTVLINEHGAHRKSHENPATPSAKTRVFTNNLKIVCHLMCHPICSWLYESMTYESVTYESVTYESVTYESVTYESVTYESFPQTNQ